MFEKADTSGDGSISRQELRDLVSAVYAARDGVRLQEQVSTTARKLLLGPSCVALLPCCSAAPPLLLKKE